MAILLWYVVLLAVLMVFAKVVCNKFFFLLSWQGEGILLLLGAYNILSI